MYKRIFLWLGFVLYTLALFAQDTLSYETQRKKVNQLLDDRSARFGQFNKSLEARTGIFGLKTKKDMQKSLDILKEIVLNDNKIFKETKILLRYKDQEKSLMADQATETGAQVDGYVKTISNFQKYQDRQQAEINSLKKEAQRNLNLFLVCLFALLLVTYLWITKRRKV